MSAAYEHPESLISTDRLEAERDDPSLRIFECTTYLDYLPPGSDAPYEVRSGREDFARGHIAGAAFLDLQGELSDPGSPRHLRFTMPRAQTLATALERRGIGDDTRVVLYSRGRMVWATRVWWMLRAIGFDDAAVLDGGWEKWAREGRATAREETVYPQASLTLRPRPGLLVDRHHVQAAMRDGDARIVNALDAELHRGENARYGRPGHIPGSVNVPSAALVDPRDNTIVPAATAHDVFRSAGVDPSGPVLLYCGGGIAATLDAFVLHQLGCPDLAVYDASMSEWARDETLPIALPGDC